MTAREQALSAALQRLSTKEPPVTSLDRRWCANDALQSLDDSLVTRVAIELVDLLRRVAEHDATIDGREAVAAVRCLKEVERKHPAGIGELSLENARHLTVVWMAVAPGGLIEASVDLAHGPTDAELAAILADEPGDHPS